MIELAYNALSSVGIKEISIELSSRVFLDKFYSYINLSPKINKIKSLIKKKDINNALKLIEYKHHQYLKDIFSCTGNFLSMKKNLKYIFCQKMKRILRMLY